MIIVQSFWWRFFSNTCRSSFLKLKLITEQYEWLYAYPYRLRMIDWHFTAVGRLFIIPYSLGAYYVYYNWRRRSLIDDDYVSNPFCSFFGSVLEQPLSAFIAHCKIPHRPSACFYYSRSTIVEYSRQTWALFCISLSRHESVGDGIWFQDLTYWLSTAYYYYLARVTVNGCLSLSVLCCLSPIVHKQWRKLAKRREYDRPI